MKALKPCLFPNCPELVSSGYCQLHKQRRIESNKRENRTRFNELDRKKDSRTIKFYNSAAWRKVSRLYRKKHPLCERCQERGKIVASDLVHHQPELLTLWNNKLNPLSWRYLQALCNDCHLEDLRKKKHLYS